MNVKWFGRRLCLSSDFSRFLLSYTIVRCWREDNIASAARYVSTVTGHLSQSPQNASLQALLSMTVPFSCRAREVTCHYGHVNRFCYLLTYKKMRYEMNLPEAAALVSGLHRLLPSSLHDCRPIYRTRNKTWIFVAMPAAIARLFTIIYTVRHNCRTL